ncbi:MAG: hypothetical protein JWO36_73 [Myxococcales bacterium]|nr:hypothetical protein [Myxococcales bacterium]
MHDDIFTPLGQAYDDFKRAVAELQRRWRGERFELDRGARDVCEWMDRSLGDLDDLYNGEIDMLHPHVAFEHASEQQRWLAYDAYKTTLGFRMYLIRITGGHAEREREFAAVMTDALLDQLTPFVSRAEDAGRRVVMGDETLQQSVERLNPELARRYPVM